jgi:hypothetical protein
MFESQTCIADLEEIVKQQSILIVQRNNELTKACTLLEILQEEIEHQAEAISAKENELTAIQDQLRDIQTIDSNPNLKPIYQNIVDILGSSQVSGFHERSDGESSFCVHQDDALGFSSHSGLQMEYNRLQEIFVSSLLCISTMEKRSRQCLVLVDKLENEATTSKGPTSPSRRLRDELSLFKSEKQQLFSFIQSRKGRVNVDSYISPNRSTSSTEHPEISQPHNSGGGWEDPSPANQHRHSLAQLRILRALQDGLRSPGPDPASPAAAAAAAGLGAGGPLEALLRRAESQAARLDSCLREAYARVASRAAP